MFFDHTSFFTFVIASVVILIVPGPSVTVIVANSLKYGVKAGLVSIAGTQAGLVILLVILALGLEAITTTLAWLFDWLRLAGGAYLVWLGYKLLRSNGDLGQPDTPDRQQGSCFWQGFVGDPFQPQSAVFLRCVFAAIHFSAGKCGSSNPVFRSDFYGFGHVSRFPLRTGGRAGRAIVDQAQCARR